MDEFEKQVDDIFDTAARNAKKISVGIVVVWLLGALLGLGFTATVIWALVRLVLHFT